MQGNQGQTIELGLMTAEPIMKFHSGFGCRKLAA